MEQTNFKLVIDIIRQAVSERLPPEDSQNNESRAAVNNLINVAEEGYVLIPWPYSQDFMKEKWFEDEAILSEDSSYFIPIKRIL